MNHRNWFSMEIVFLKVQSQVILGWCIYCCGRGLRRKGVAGEGIAGERVAGVEVEVKTSVPGYITTKTIYQQQQQSLLAFPFNTNITHIKITITIIHNTTFLCVHKFVF